MRKTHNKKMGNGGGDYDGTKAKDQAGVADYWFNQSRESFGENFATKDDLSALQQQQAAEAATSEPYKESEELTKAKEKVQAWEQGGQQNPGSPYGGNESASSDVYNSALSQVKEGGVASSVDEFASKVSDRKNNQEGAQAFASDYLSNVKKAVPMVGQF